MSEKFSPGPWRACGHDRGGCKCGFVWSVDDDKPVAQALLRWDEGDTEYPSAEVVANARLIAAAPELLDALESVLGAGDLCDCEGPLCRSARALIKRIRGAG